MRGAPGGQNEGKTVNSTNVREQLPCSTDDRKPCNRDPGTRECAVALISGLLLTVTLTAAGFLTETSVTQADPAHFLHWLHCIDPLKLLPAGFGMMFAGYRSLYLFPGKKVMFLLLMPAVLTGWVFLLHGVFLLLMPDDFLKALCSICS